MSTGELPGRSMARAHLSQLIEMFGTDGWLQVSTTSASGTAEGASDVAPGDDAEEDAGQT